jgi:hypothetical protein
MEADYQIPAPLLFNPLKHHLGFIKEFVNLNIEKPAPEIQTLTKELRHIGTSVMDIYTGPLMVADICSEVAGYLVKKNIILRSDYMDWTGTEKNNFRISPLSDSSEWTFKYHNSSQQFVHFFPARGSKHTFRVKSNTLKSALIYVILIGKDFVTGDDLNKVRPLMGLSPIKDATDNKAILEMIEILRG